MTETLTIPARFNGPPDSANGGYTSGRVAQLVGAEEVEVSLRRPPPLDQPLEVVREGERVELRDGDTLVAEGGPTELLFDVPDAVPRGEVAAAERPGARSGPPSIPSPPAWSAAPTASPATGCASSPLRYLTARGSSARAGLPGELESDGDGWVRPELAWAALDCPTSAPVANFGEGPPMVLASLAARLGCPVRVGEPHTILSWGLEVDGRKRRAAAALYDSDGVLRCASRALWIELRQ